MKKLFREWLNGWRVFILAYSVVFPLWFLIDFAETLEKRKWLHEPWNTIADTCIFFASIFLYPFLALSVWRTWFQSDKLHSWLRPIVAKDDRGDVQPDPDADTRT